MSGFVGLLKTDQSPIDGTLLAQMTAALAFRGPDAQHSWAHQQVGLGHTLFRTAFESAHEIQPCSLDGAVWIAADARIDGRAALVQRLREQGRATTLNAPDVELILHAYLTWGDACLDYLCGDFAFVLWDQRQAHLLAARDQLGVAQLFYTQVDATLLLSNTLQSLLLHPGVVDTLDEQTLADIALFTVYLDDTATGYAAIRRLPPGHKLTWDAHGLRVERYWRLRQPAHPLYYRRPEEYAEHFRLLFDQAVGDRLRTDRVGSQLSGGMDSTSIAVTAHRWLQANNRPFDLRAYTIEYRSLIPDEEGTLAAQVATYAGFPVEVLTGETYLSAEPPAAPAWMPPEPGAATLWVMQEVCQRTAAFARVLLTGYGGDPLLYSPDFTWQRAWVALQQGAWQWPLRRLAARWRLRQRQRQPQPLPAWVNLQWARRLDLAERIALFQQRARREQVGLVEAPLWRTFFAWSDAGYNGLPLSIRFPFFDLRLLEFVLAIPPVPWLENKQLLRAAMGNRLPEVVRTRPKTLMPGNVRLEHHKQLGAPAWEIDLLALSELAAYVDPDWLRFVQRQSAAAQAHIWETQRPPVQLAYWLRHRPRWDQRGDEKVDPVIVGQIRSFSNGEGFKRGTDYATTGQ